MQFPRTNAATPDDRSGSLRWRALLTSLAAALIVASVPAVAWAVPTRMPLAQEDEAAASMAGEIIADGRARLPRGDAAWTLRSISIPAGDELAVEEFPTGFVLVADGAITLRAEDDEEPTELADGEADFFPDRKAGTIANPGDAPATIYEIALVPAEDAAPDEPTDQPAAEPPPAVVGEPFAAPEGETFLFELVQNTLTGADEATIPAAASGAPVVYLTTDGTAQLQAGEQVVDLTAGQFALLTGEVQLRAAGAEPATYVVAAIGEEAEARDPSARAGREDRERVRQGSGQADGAPRVRRVREGRTPRVRTGGGRGGGQAQQPAPGAPGGGPTTGDPAAPTAPAAGTPGVDPTLEPTLPADPTVPADGTPPPAETPPPAVETLAPTETPLPAETPTPEPTVFVPPTNPPVPDVPGVPTVPPAETVPPEAPPAEEPPPPAEETPAPLEEESAEPAADA